MQPKMWCEDLLLPLVHMKKRPYDQQNMLSLNSAVVSQLNLSGILNQPIWLPGKSTLLLKVSTVEMLSSYDWERWWKELYDYKMLFKSHINVAIDYYSKRISMHSKKKPKMFG